MESKIVILIDTLNSKNEINDNDSEYINGKTTNNLITYNAMGRANTLLYVIWDTIDEKYVNQQTGKALKIQDETENYHCPHQTC